MLIIFPKNFPFSYDTPISPRTVIFGPSLKPVTRHISKTVHYYPRQQVLHPVKDVISSWFVVVHVVVHVMVLWWFMVVCGGSIVVLWWFMVVCGGSVMVVLWWFVMFHCHGFVVVHDVLFSKILQKKVMWPSIQPIRVSNSLSNLIFDETCYLPLSI